MGSFVWLFMLVSVGSASAAAFNCTGPFMCSADMLRQLSMTPAALWYTLIPGGQQQYAAQWIATQASCCRHCVWDLGYPLANHIVLASDRTTYATAEYLDCIGFQVQFRWFEFDGLE